MPFKCSNFITCTCVPCPIHRCICPSGYNGKDCSGDINDCDQHICQNGATCVDGLNKYSCKCVKGYSGKLSEQIMKVSQHLQS